MDRIDDGGIEWRRINRRFGIFRRHWPAEKTQSWFVRLACKWLKRLPLELATR